VRCTWSISRLDVQLGHEIVGALPHFIAVHPPQRLRRSRVSGQHDGVRVEVLWYSLRCRVMADQSAQHAHVHTTQTVAEELDGAVRRVHLRSQEPQQGRLARALGPQQSPVLPGGDRPVDTVEDQPVRGMPADADVRENGDTIGTGHCALAQAGIHSSLPQGAASIDRHGSCMQRQNLGFTVTADGVN
jgi:hypothetical protein